MCSPEEPLPRNILTQAAERRVDAALGREPRRRRRRSAASSCGDHRGVSAPGEVLNAVNLPFIDAKTLRAGSRICAGREARKLLSQLAPANIECVRITYGGREETYEHRSDHARDPDGAVSTRAHQNVNNVNVAPPATAGV